MHKADLQHDDNVLQEKLEAIYQLRRTRSKVNWDRSRYLDLLEKFGKPHLNLPPVIHVAGTNGKGSIIAMLLSILESAGLKVHCYTSPHLINVNERIYLSGQNIDNDYLEELIDKALEYNKGAPLSFFEITTALAFKAFSDIPADILLLEVGMGGRLDCTNVIDAPIATIINRISLDHTEFLGDDVVSIAKEKAGIIKEGVPCIIGYQGESDVLKVLDNEVMSCNAVAVQWSIERIGDAMNLSYEGVQYEFPVPALIGAHQVQNAGVAIACLLSIGDKIEVSYNAMCDGLGFVRWRGRLQQVYINGFDDVEIWLDCGHNDSAGEALAEHIKQWGKPVHLIMGMLGHKDLSGFLKPLLSLIEDIHIVPIVFESDSKSASDIDLNIEIYEHDSLLEAIEYISSNKLEGIILIAGSVYLAGEVLKHCSNDLNLG